MSRSDCITQITREFGNIISSYRIFNLNIDVSCGSVLLRINGHDPEHVFVVDLYKNNCHRLPSFGNFCGPNAIRPSARPTAAPLTSEPTDAPLTSRPTTSPTRFPTPSPTLTPAIDPSRTPSAWPSNKPTDYISQCNFHVSGQYCSGGQIETYQRQVILEPSWIFLRNCESMCCLLPECKAYETSEQTFGVIDTCTLFNSNTTLSGKDKPGFQACYEAANDAFETGFDINTLASNPLVMLMMNFILFPILLCALVYLLYVRGDEDDDEEEEDKGIAMNAMEVLDLDRKKWIDNDESSTIESDLIPKYTISLADAAIPSYKGPEGVREVSEQIEGRPNGGEHLPVDSIEMKHLRRSIRDKKSPSPNRSAQFNRRPSKRLADMSPNRFQTDESSQIVRNPSAKRFYNIRSCSVASDNTDKYSIPSVVLKESHFSSDEFGTESICGPECAICADKFMINEAVTTLPCKHNFHTLCLIPWLRSKATCPLCRYSLKPLE